MISAIGADREPPPGTDPVFAAYLRAKGAADADLALRTSLNWTILRPGRLTDEPGTGLVRLAVRTGRGAVPRDDVAAVLLALLETLTGGMTLELVDRRHAGRRGHPSSRLHLTARHAARSGTTNVQGEMQQKLDVVANDLFLRADE